MYTIEYCAHFLTCLPLRNDWVSSGVLRTGVIFCQLLFRSPSPSLWSRSLSNFGAARQARFHSSNPCVVSGGLDFPNTICMPVAVRDGIGKVYIATVLGASAWLVGTKSTSVTFDFRGREASLRGFVAEFNEYLNSTELVAVNTMLIHVKAHSRLFSFTIT